MKPEEIAEIEAQTLFAISSPTGRHIGLWKDRDVALAVLSEEPAGSTMQELVPVSALREARERSNQLAAWQCIHTDGKTGIVCDERGNQSCAKDVKPETSTVRELMEKNARLETALRTAQNAAKTLAYAQGTELQHLRQNAAYDHKLRAEHESLIERDAIMTDQVATLTDRVARLEAALKPFADFSERHGRFDT